MTPSRIARLMILCFTAGAAACLFPTGPEDDKRPVQMSGTVYAFFGPNPADPLGPGLFSVPVSGAVLSTSLDSATATTDGSGNYALVTVTPRMTCQPFTVTIRAAGRPTYSLRGTWVETGQRFALDPPTPSAAAVDPVCR